MGGTGTELVAAAGNGCCWAPRSGVGDDGKVSGREILRIGDLSDESSEIWALLGLFEQ